MVERINPSLSLKRQENGLADKRRILLPHSRLKIGLPDKR
jgi:hypothetical protein